MDDIENSYDEHVSITVDDMKSSHDELRSERQRKEVSFGDDFYTCLVENEPCSYFEAISSTDALLWKEAIKTELDYISKNQPWVSRLYYHLTCDAPNTGFFDTTYL